jgi:hypothetical protein
MRRLMLLALLGVALVGCGDDDSDDGGEPPTGTAESDVETKAAVCQNASKPLAKAIRSSLSIGGGGDVRRLRVVRLEDPPEAPLNGYRKGVYAVAGEFTGPGMDGTIGVWAASTDMVRTGGGLIIGADSVTREFSELGAAAADGSPAAEYAGEVAGSSEGETARKCAGSG